MSYLLDTCVLSALRKEISPATAKWFTEKEDSLFFLSVVTLGEIWDGIERLPPSKKKSQLEDWFYGKILPEFKGKILPIDERVALEWGQLNASLERKGLHIGVQDLYIAATAKAHSLMIVTLNTKDFVPTEVPVINPF